MRLLVTWVSFVIHAFRLMPSFSAAVHQLSLGDVYITIVDEMLRMPWITSHEGKPSYPFGMSGVVISV